MTTVWYGDRRSEYTYQAVTYISVPVQYARPCNFGQQNEARIIMELTELTWHKKGYPQGLMRFSSHLGVLAASVQKFHCKCAGSLRKELKVKVLDSEQEPYKLHYFTN
jgi:hypothetical protein